ncbi:MAG: hypothetical protein ACRCUS_09525, partial [Anaerovoracaceae bacterium]
MKRKNTKVILHIKEMQSVLRIGFVLFLSFSIIASAFAYPQKADASSSFGDLTIVQESSDAEKQVVVDEIEDVEPDIPEFEIEPSIEEPTPIIKKRNAPMKAAMDISMTVDGGSPIDITGQYLSAAIAGISGGTAGKAIEIDIKPGLTLTCMNSASAAYSFPTNLGSIKIKGGGIITANNSGSLTSVIYYGGVPTVFDAINHKGYIVGGVYGTAAAPGVALA